MRTKCFSIAFTERAFSLQSMNMLPKVNLKILRKIMTNEIILTSRRLTYDLTDTTSPISAHLFYNTINVKELLRCGLKGQHAMKIKKGG